MRVRSSRRQSIELKIYHRSKHSDVILKPFAGRILKHIQNKLSWFVSNILRSCEEYLLMVLVSLPPIQGVERVCKASKRR